MLESVKKMKAFADNVTSGSNLAGRKRDVEKVIKRKKS